MTTDERSRHVVTVVGHTLTCACGWTEEWQTVQKGETGHQLRARVTRQAQTHIDNERTSK